MSDERGVITADIGGTRLRVAAFDERGEMRDRRAIPTPHGRPEALAELVRAVADDAPFAVAGVVAGVAGAVDYREGRPLRLPNIPGWQGRLDAQSLADACDLPAVVANDADLAALGEHRYGAGRGVQDLVYVTVSTGVGGGVVLNGQLAHGRRSIAEIGWTLIDHRDESATVEYLGSGTALERIAGAPAKRVSERAQAGDAEAAHLFRRVADAAAAGVLNMVMLFMPERVVVGGGVSAAGDLLLGPIRERVERLGPRMSIVPEVVTAEGGDDVGLLGAYALWRDIEQPPPPPTRIAPRLPLGADTGTGGRKP